MSIIFIHTAQLLFKYVTAGKLKELGHLTEKKGAPGEETSKIAKYRPADMATKLTQVKILWTCR